MYGGHGGPQSASRGAAFVGESATGMLVLVLFRLEEVLKMGGAYGGCFSSGASSQVGRHRDFVSECCGIT